MRLWLTLGLVISVLVVAGCAKEEIMYSSKMSVGRAGEELKIPSTASKAQPQDDSLYVLHRWKEDDSLSFLAIYYTGKLEYQKDIEEANPDLSFGGRLPAGTQVWIPAGIVRPEVKKSFTPVTKGGRPEAPPDSPLDRGVIHTAEGQETLSMVAAFYTGNAGNAQELVQYNPGLAPDAILSPGQEVFIPVGMVMKDLQPDLVLVSRPRPQGASGVGSAPVAESTLGEEDIREEPKTFDQLPPEKRPGYKPDRKGPQPVPYTKKAEPARPTKTAKAPPKVKKVNRAVPHKPSSKHKR